MMNLSTTSKANVTNLQESSKYMLLSPTAEVVIIGFHVLIFVLGIPGNSMVIYMLGIKERYRRNCDIHIVSLAVSDLLSAIFLPIVTIHDIITKLAVWKLLGTFGCKLFVNIDHISILVSAFILMLISLERLRVIGSHQLIRYTRKRVFIETLLIWITAFAIVSPSMYTMRVKNGVCMYVWSRENIFIYYAMYINLSCFIPAVVMLVVYTRSIYLLSKKQIPGDNKILKRRRKRQYKWMTKMFSIIALLFFILTMPNTIIHFISSYYGTYEPFIYLSNMENLQSWSYVLYAFSHFSCCVNPFIYIHMHISMRKMKSKIKEQISSLFLRTSGKSSERRDGLRIYKALPLTAYGKIDREADRLVNCPSPSRSVAERSKVELKTPKITVSPSRKNGLELRVGATRGAKAASTSSLSDSLKLNGPTTECGCLPDSLQLGYDKETQV